MKTVTLTAIVAILVAIPLILKKKVSQPIGQMVSNHVANSEDYRYTIDDFLT